MRWVFKVFLTDSDCIWNMRKGHKQSDTLICESSRGLPPAVVYSGNVKTHLFSVIDKWSKSIEGYNSNQEGQNHIKTQENQDHFRTSFLIGSPRLLGVIIELQQSVARCTCEKILICEWYIKASSLEMWLRCHSDCFPSGSSLVKSTSKTADPSHIAPYILIWVWQ